MASGSDHDAIVVGAGIAGLCAARELVAAGRRVLLLDKGRGVGGRMATRRLGSAVCDHGAQFFTVRGRAFGGIVADAHAAGAVVEWCRGFAGAGADGGDGHPRWRGARAMTDLPKRLAALLGEEAPGRCVIRTDARVASVGMDGTAATVVLETPAGAETFTAAGCLLTPPVPQSLALLAAGGFAAASAAAAESLRLLETIDYDPCFALMVVLDRPSRVPAPGAIRFAADGPGPLAWLADNQRKGISAVPALTAHATGVFSRERFDAPSVAVAAALEEQLRPWIDGDPATAIVERSLQRWKYALPTTILPAPLVAVSHEPPIACCGDAFAGPRVEGAAASGLAAGRWLARVLAGEAEA